MSSGDDPDPSRLYFYTPNKPAAIFFATAFALAGLAHLWLGFSSKSFRMTSCLVFGCALLATAFSTRAILAEDDRNGQVFTASTMLDYAAPPLMQLANFQILGRVFYWVPYFAPMHPARMLLTLGSICAVIELLTVMGIAFLSNRDLPEVDLQRGDYMTKGSLVVQLATIGIFYALLGVFHRCCYLAYLTRNQGLVRLLTLLYTTTALLLGRTIYRMAELFGSPPNPLSSSGDTLPPAVRYEALFYIFDALLLLLFALAWLFWHPRLYLPITSKRYLAQDAKTELAGPGWADSRSLTETFLNPFATLTARAGHQRPFWEHNGYELQRRR
ncbi:hypothetical protein QBC47DRAFT_395229 [Echria macrotheca]|uniref:Uncharacterized protein n=1 Tax=Echria macrotheca TaxID=438768 RepID=A0AAJ0F1E7_9PEZI|nr:hypothetical protein QBC47DRAFT_395229 [Echria macrotheca]